MTPMEIIARLVAVDDMNSIFDECDYYVSMGCCTTQSVELRAVLDEARAALNLLATKEPT